MRESYCREKLLVRNCRPVPKPTQVGRMRNLRRTSDLALRNSAKYIRNFGIRMAGAGELPAEEAGAGGRREAQATVYHKHRCLLKRNLTYRC